MNWLEENWFRAGILTAISIAGLSVAYYFVLFLPQQEQETTLKSYDCDFAETQAREKWGGDRAVGFVQTFSPHFSDYLGRCVVESMSLGENVDGKFIDSKILIDSRDQSAIAEYATADGVLFTELSEKEYEELKRKILYNL